MKLFRPRRARPAPGAVPDDGPRAPGVQSPTLSRRHVPSLPATPLPLLMATPPGLAEPLRDGDIEAGGSDRPFFAEAAELARLRAIKSERDDLLALAAHELRNPLHALALQLALARTSAGNAGAPEVAERLRRAEASLKRYAERVTVLMDLLAAPGSPYPLTRRPTDLAALVATVAEGLEQEARSRGIALHCEHPGTAMHEVDPVVVEQVIDNLLLNAFKHSGGRQVTLRLRSDASGWTVSVADDGHGIAPEDQQRIFEKFSVAVHSPRGNGSGLGLWIVGRLACAMQAAISLDSLPGRGSTFTLHVPSIAT